MCPSTTSQSQRLEAHLESGMSGCCELSSVPCGGFSACSPLLWGPPKCLCFHPVFAQAADFENQPQVSPHQPSPEGRTQCCSPAVYGGPPILSHTPLLGRTSFSYLVPSIYSSAAATRWECWEFWQCPRQSAPEICSPQKGF